MNETCSMPVFEITDCYAGSVVYPPGGTYGPRQQAEIQLILLHRGSMRIEVDDVACRYGPGQVILLTPNHRVYIAFAEAEETWHRWVTVNPDEIDEQASAFLEQLPASLPLSGNMNALVDVLVDLQRQELSGDSAVQHSLAQAAIQLYASESRKGAAAGKPSAIAHVKSFVQENYGDELTLVRLASAARMTSGHLVRVFKQHEGITPMEYVWQYRLERGVELLRTTGLLVGEVAERCGFKTSYHFARRVKAETGSTPTQIRWAHWGIQRNKGYIRT